MKKYFLLFMLVSFSNVSFSFENYAKPDDIEPNDKKLYHEIAESTDQQLTIVSWNIRNLGAYSRSIKDYFAMIDLVDEADVIVLQEVGLGLLRTDDLTEYQSKTLEAVKNLWQVYLGNDWVVILADQGSGNGAGRETSMVAHRKLVNGNSITASFNGFHELGDSRDMPIWEFKLNSNTPLLIGSVHLTPHDPERSSEMLNMVDWIENQSENNAIVLGDMNYGYQKTSGIENYIGENKIIELDNEKKVYHVFKEFSYLGKGKSDDLRTNLGFRSGAYFYDQFLLSPLLAGKMSFGGQFLKDVGMIAFGVHDKYFSDSAAKKEKNRSYSLLKYKKYTDSEKDNSGFIQEFYDKAITDAEKQSLNDSTWSISDHRPIWIKLNLF